MRRKAESSKERKGSGFIQRLSGGRTETNAAFFILKIRLYLKTRSNSAV